MANDQIWFELVVWRKVIPDNSTSKEVTTNGNCNSVKSYNAWFERFKITLLGFQNSSGAAFIYLIRLIKARCPSVRDVIKCKTLLGNWNRHSLFITEESAGWSRCY